MNTNMYKLDVDGNYLPYYGYTSISWCNSNNLDIIEKFIRESPLSEYYSALPSTSYHMTIFNIWVPKYGKNMLPQAKKYLQDYYASLHENYGEEQANTWLKDIKKSMNINFDEVLFEDLKYVDCVMKETLNTSYNVSVNLCAKKTIKFIVNVPQTTINKLDIIRSRCSEVFQKEDPLTYHITLAYQYKSIPEDKYNLIKFELIKLQHLVEEFYDNKLSLNAPRVAYFNSMKHYYTMEEKYQ